MRECSSDSVDLSGCACLSGTKFATCYLKFSVRREGEEMSHCVSFSVGVLRYKKCQFFEEPT